jgi:hypothetical protein
MRVKRQRLSVMPVGFQQPRRPPRGLSAKFYTTHTLETSYRFDCKLTKKCSVASCFEKAVRTVRTDERHGRVVNMHVNMMSQDCAGV